MVNARIRFYDRLIYSSSSHPLSADTGGAPASRDLKTTRDLARCQVLIDSKVSLNVRRVFWELTDRTRESERGSHPSVSSLRSVWLNPFNFF